jgi:hypothetical protein
MPLQSLTQIAYADRYTLFILLGSSLLSFAVFTPGLRDPRQSLILADKIRSDARPYSPGARIHVFVPQDRTGVVN